MRKRLWQLKRGTTLLALGLTALLALGGATSAQAQVTSDPSWGVVDFEVKAGGDSSAGAQAAQAVSDEFGKQFGNRSVLMIPPDTVRRNVGDLGLPMPLNSADVARLGTALAAQTLVTGEIVNMRTVEDGSSKRVDVLMRVIVNDVASGIVINGAAVSGRSGVRNPSTETSALIQEALSDAAYKSVREILARNLPSATVLTVGLDGNALLNIGLQSGLKSGMRTIVTRGNEQVATGVIVRLDADSAYMKPERVLKGISRADKVRVIFDVPTIAPNWNASGDAVVKKERKGGNNGGLVTVLIVVLILFALFGGGRGGSQGLVGGVTAEPTILANDAPAVRISFTRDAFLRGNQEGPVRFHVWRNDVSDTPVAVAQGTNSSVVDDINLSQQPGPGNPWSDADPTVPSPGVCAGDSIATNSSATPVVPGTPYQYSVQVVYRINFLSLPGQSTGGSGGGGLNTTGTNTTGTNTTGTNTTGTNTTGTNTTGTNTTGTNTTGTNNTGGGGEFCYYVSPERVPASGLATPLNRAQQRSPDNDAMLTTPTNFRFTSVRGPVASVQIEYVLQISSDLSFSSNRTINVEKFVDLTAAGGSVISTPAVNTATIFPGSEFLYWRVGARNIDDSPGPVAVGGQRYIFSSVRRFRRTVAPPAAGASN